VDFLWGWKNGEEVNLFSEGVMGDNGLWCFCWNLEDEGVVFLFC